MADGLVLPFLSAIKLEQNLDSATVCMKPLCMSIFESVKYQGLKRDD